MKKTLRVEANLLLIKQYFLYLITTIKDTHGVRQSMVD